MVVTAGGDMGSLLTSPDDDADASLWLPLIEVAAAAAANSFINFCCCCFCLTISAKDLGLLGSTDHAAADCSTLCLS